jgi:hypothetical protein
MPAPAQTMRTADVQRLADRLTSAGTTRNFVEQVTEMQAECRLAAWVIKTLLRARQPERRLHDPGRRGAAAMGTLQPGAEDFDMLWLLFRTFLPQIGGLVPMLARR